MTDWIQEWPTEPGAYWFYGWRFRHQPDEPRELSFMEVRRTAVGVLVYITRGHFMYAEEADGLWSKVELPVLPTGSQEVRR